MEEATLCFTVSSPRRVLVFSKNELKRTFCDVCEDILHDIEVSDIENQASDYRKVDVTLSESALGTTDDFVVRYMESISTACYFNTKLKYVYLKLNIDTKFSEW